MSTVEGSSHPKRRFATGRGKPYPHPLPDCRRWPLVEAPWPSALVGPVRLRLPTHYDLISRETGAGDWLADDPKDATDTLGWALGIWFGHRRKPPRQVLTRSVALYGAPRGEFSTGAFTPPAHPLAETEYRLQGAAGRQWDVVAYVLQWERRTLFNVCAYAAWREGVFLQVSGGGEGPDMEGEVLAIIASVSGDQDEGSA